MIENLFGSKTRVKLLHLFYINPNRSFYVREITRKIDEQINSVRRELANLLQIGLIKSDNTSGNKLYYEVDQKYKHYEHLHGIFTGMNTKKNSIVSENDMTQRIKALGSVQLAILTGHFTRDRLAPIDLLIVGDVNRTRTDKFVAELEEEEGTELRYTIFSPEDFEYRFNLNDHFLSTVLSTKYTTVVGDIPKVATDQELEEQLEKVAATTKSKSKVKSEK